jgi:hypothetical protein
MLAGVASSSPFSPLRPRFWVHSVQLVGFHGHVETEASFFSCQPAKLRICLERFHGVVIRDAVSRMSECPNPES